MLQESMKLFICIITLKICYFKWIVCCFQFVIFTCLACRVVKAVSHIIAHLSCHLLNLSFISGIVPDNLTITCIAPLYKRKDKNWKESADPSQSKHVFSKAVNDKLVHNRLFQFLSQHNILYENQYMAFFWINLQAMELLT